MNPSGSSLYPQRPEGSRVVVRVSPNEITLVDRILVASSSLFIVGSVVWVPAFYVWAWKRWKAIPKEEIKRRAVYAALVLGFTGILAAGPQHSRKFGDCLGVRKWRLWKAWIKFFAMEIIVDQPLSSILTLARDDKAVLAFVPHGIFPFPLALAVLPEIAQQAFGIFRPVVATATALFPLVRDILMWVDPVDACRASVDRALSEGSRIGLVPGGIAEMFEGYPKPNTKPNEEYAIVRKGFLRMAIKHGVPVVPVYCFGATKMFRRLQLPVLERVSKLLRVSLVVFFGAWGLPIPFRQRLLYVMGQPIVPATGIGNNNQDGASVDMEQQVDIMHQQFCDELLRLFERHRDSYGWSQKQLKFLCR